MGSIISELDFNWLLNLVLFSSVLLGTPGPAVIALFHSGINFGFKKTLPFFFGIISGFLFNLSISFLGITVFIEHETVFGIFKIVMLGYVFYLAYKIATSKTLEDKINVRPMSFFQGLFLNLLNPKAYVASLSVISQFSIVTGYVNSIIIIIFINILMAMNCKDCGVYLAIY